MTTKPSSTGPGCVSHFANTNTLLTRRKELLWPEFQRFQSLVGWPVASGPVLRGALWWEGGSTTLVSPWWPGSKDSLKDTSHPSSHQALPPVPPVPPQSGAQAFSHWSLGDF